MTDNQDVWVIIYVMNSQEKYIESITYTEYIL